MGFHFIRAKIAALKALLEFLVAILSFRKTGKEQANWTLETILGESTPSIIHFLFHLSIQPEDIANSPTNGDFGNQGNSRTGGVLIRSILEMLVQQSENDSKLSQMLRKQLNIITSDSRFVNALTNALLWCLLRSLLP